MTTKRTRRELIALVPSIAFGAPATPLPPLDEAGFQKLLAANKGKVVLFDFWATWCEPCRKEMPLLSKMSERLKAKGLVVITVSADEPEDNARAREFLNVAKFNGPSYLKQAKNDEKFINSVDPKWSGALPAMFLYDKAGRKAKSFIGETEIPVLEAAITKLL